MVLDFNEFNWIELWNSKDDIVKSCKKSGKINGIFTFGQGPTYQHSWWVCNILKWRHTGDWRARKTRWLQCKQETTKKKKEKKKEKREREMISFDSITLKLSISALSSVGYLSNNFHLTNFLIIFQSNKYTTKILLRYY